MSELRRRFVETLQIAEEDIIFPENPQLFVAIGAALYGEETAQLNTLLARLSTDDSAKLQPSHTLAPLFATEEELAVLDSVMANLRWKKNLLLIQEQPFSVSMRVQRQRKSY